MVPAHTMTNHATTKMSSTSTEGNDAPQKSITIRLLGKFNLIVGRRAVTLGMTCQRLLTLIALKEGQINRTQAAGMLWPEASTVRASANLRSAVWRLHRLCEDVIDVSFYDLRLAPCVEVDIHHVFDVASELLDPSSITRAEDLTEAMGCNLYQDIAPNVGDDDWLRSERERFRQLRVHALESLSGRLVAAGWHGAAAEAALGAIRADPFRESAYQLLITVHLAQGSQYEARRHHAAYCDLLRSEMGLVPSPEFMRLIDRDSGTSAR
jgi:DNA-binding SARP family transcriptional activator